MIVHPALALQAWFYFLLLGYNFWMQIRHVPYYHTWINCLFAFEACTYAWGALLLLIATYVRAHWNIFTILFYIGAVFSIGSMSIVGSRSVFCSCSVLLPVLC